MSDKRRIAICHPERRHAAHGLCSLCYQKARRLDPATREKALAPGRAWRARNKDKANASIREYYKRVGTTKCAYMRSRRAELRNKALIKYGHMCICCGERKRGFLTFDHMNNDGAAHRRELRGASVRFYLWLLEETREDIGILCWNCNCGRQHNGGVCPHVR